MYERMDRIVSHTRSRRENENWEAQGSMSRIFRHHGNSWVILGIALFGALPLSWA